MTIESVDEAVARLAAGNIELCKLIESKGIDLAAERPIDLHFWAHGENAAGSLAQALQSRGWTEVRRNQSIDPGIWNVEVQIHSSVLAVVNPSFTEQLARLANTNHGEFDGWGTAI